VKHFTQVGNSCGEGSSVKAPAEAPASWHGTALPPAISMAPSRDAREIVDDWPVGPAPARHGLGAGAAHKSRHQRRQEDKQPYRNAVQPGSAPGKKLKQSIAHYNSPHSPLRILSHCNQDTMKRFTKAAGLPA
jgi:hypothetical protein